MLLFVAKSWVLLLRQIWIVKCSSNNLSNENLNTGVSWEMLFQKIVVFGILINVLSWNIYFKLLRRNNKLKINNFLTNIWRNNWRFSIWRCKRTLLLANFFSILYEFYWHLSVLNSELNTVRVEEECNKKNQRTNRN